MWSVGIIGAGPGVSALHLPTLARLSDRFRVVHIVDSGSGRSKPLADRVGARSGSDVHAMLRGESIDVALICSPPAEHAEHVRAALDAGVAGILCEKPLATSVLDAQELTRACREQGVALLVGTNHLHDPGWQQLRRRIAERQMPVESVRITMSLPPNARYHDLVSETPDAERAPSRQPPPGLPAHVQAGIVRQLLFGLAVHDLPAIRDLAPGFDGIDFARFVAPLGYAVGYRAGHTRVQLAAVMREEGADASWRLTVSAGGDRFDLDFPPPFVHAGSAAVCVRDTDGTRSILPRATADGYELEWRALAQLLEGLVPLEYDESLADALFALELADAAAHCIEASVA